MNARAIDRATEELHVIDETMTCIEQQYGKGLMLERAEFEREKLPYGARRVQGCAAAHTPRHRTPGGCDQLRRGCHAQLALLAYPELIAGHRAPYRIGFRTFWVTQRILQW